MGAAMTIPAGRNLLTKNGTISQKVDLNVPYLLVFAHSLQKRMRKLSPDVVFLP